MLVSSPEASTDNPPDPPSQPSIPSPIPVRPVPRALAGERGVVRGVVRSEKSLSLENVLAQSQSQNQGNLVNLIEVRYADVTS